MSEIAAGYGEGALGSGDGRNGEWIHGFTGGEIKRCFLNNGG